MNWLKKLLRWRVRRPAQRADISEIVRKALSNPETQRKLADNITRNNSLLEKLNDKIR